MDHVARWLSVAADVLNAPTAQTAQDLFGGELMESMHADIATRVGLTPEAPQSIDISVSARGRVPPREHWPRAEDARAHPLSQYYASTDDRSPVRLTDLLAAGWTLDEEHHGVMDALGITVNQLALPCSPRLGQFDGWVVLNDHGFSDHVQARMVGLRDVLVGLDRHIELLRRHRAAHHTDRINPGLTPREEVVLALVAAGSTAEGIAARLLISPRTVHKHQQNLYRKLGAVDRLSAVLRAQELGLLPVPPGG